MDGIVPSPVFDLRIRKANLYRLANRYLHGIFRLISPVLVGQGFHSPERLEDGLVRDEGRIGVTPEALRSWADTLCADDQVALEATGNSDAIATLLASRVGRVVVVSNPVKTRAIAEAKVETDKVDARILAQLVAADFLPPVWLPDERIRSLRRQVSRRAHLVRQRTRIKNQVHAILARNLAPTPPASDTETPSVRLRNVASCRLDQRDSPGLRRRRGPGCRQNPGPDRCRDLLTRRRV